MIFFAVAIGGPYLIWRYLVAGSELLYDFIARLIASFHSIGCCRGQAQARESPRRLGLRRIPIRRAFLPCQ